MMSIVKYVLQNDARTRFTCYLRLH